MDRLTSYKDICKREMICRYEDCDTCEEYCPDLNADNCPCLQEVLGKLAEYEDLKEQGRLLELPCAVGDKIYSIGSDGKISEREVSGFKMIVTGWAVDVSDWCYLFEEFGKNVFRTKKEAEAALKKPHSGSSQ